MARGQGINPEVVGLVARPGAEVFDLHLDQHGEVFAAGLVDVLVEIHVHDASPHDEAVEHQPPGAKERFKEARVEGATPPGDVGPLDFVRVSVAFAQIGDEPLEVAPTLPRHP